MRSGPSINEKKIEPVEKILQPFQQFFRTEASAGILLLACTVLALAWSNSAWSESYTALWEVHLSVGVGAFTLSESLLHWINDGLMAVFFFVVGLEIKREILIGELSSLRKALLPIFAAVGGMAVPAGIYYAFNAGTPTAGGWGTAMATDIAFALGVLALLGSRVPAPLKVFLTAVAIVDDLGAILVIALFYTADISWMSLLFAAGFLVLLIAANMLGVRHPLVYLLLGIGLWLGFLKSGIHATVAGVLSAMCIPARSLLDEYDFLKVGHRLLDEFGSPQPTGLSPIKNEHKLSVVKALEKACLYVETPLQRLEPMTHPWMAFVIMPLFALANAGVTLPSDFGPVLAQPLALGTIVGLVAGKQIGLTLFSWVAVRLGWASLPAGVNWKHIYGAGWLAGIGFTMSIFIATLAFDGEDLNAAKTAILAASLLAGFGGAICLSRVSAASR